MGQVVTRDALISALGQARADGRRIVLTNGVFDLLHVGHARLLDTCRAQAGTDGRPPVVVVGVNADASVRTLGKGPDRPLVPEDDRAELLAALGSVDFVTIFEEPTAVNLARAVKPDLYVKGGDYAVDAPASDLEVASARLPEASVVREGGGSILLVPTVTGRSTTALARRIAACAPLPPQGGRGVGG
ncbi:MAG: hypothetical protein EXR45_08135 [Chloroflexi bacterium]|nr:hypothetical protein [Chloroflexota bacterium]